MGKIADVRKEKGLTQKELADRLGVSQQNISQYENGKRQPKLETLKKIAVALDVPVSMLDVEASDVIRVPQMPDLFAEVSEKMAAEAYIKHILDNKYLGYYPLSNVLDRFIPLSDENRNKALDYMDYLKERQDKE